MTSDAEEFASKLDSFKEFVDDDGRHFYIIQFEDDSGRVFLKRKSEDERPIAEFGLQYRGAKDAMKNIASATDFEFDKDANTQQNLRSLMREG